MRLILVLLLLAGCNALGPTAEQIKEMSATSSSFCWEQGASLYTPAIASHYASFGGKSTGTAGGGGVATCGKSTVEFTNEGRRVGGPGTTTTTTTTVK